MMAGDFGNTGVQMRGIDSILAFPQYYFNFKLDNLLKNGKTTTGKSLKDVELGKDNQVFLKGTASKLAVRLFVPDNPRKVLFQVSFSSGTCTYWDVMKVPPEGPLLADITGTTFSFVVDLSRAEIKMEDLPKDVKKDVEISTKTLAAGTFTIQNLFMDFQSAALDQYDEATTVWPPNMNAVAKTMMPIYIKSYIELLKESNGHILGYDVTIKNPGGKADPTPTFPPTKLSYAVNQYLPNANPKPTDLKPDFDCITYNMMAGKSEIPHLSPWPWMGNFVLPSADSAGPKFFGTMVVSNNQIMTEWLAPKLDKLVTSYWTLKDNSGMAPNATTEYGSLLHQSDGTLSYSSPVAKGKSTRKNAFSNDVINWDMSVIVTVKHTVGPKDPCIIIHKASEWSMDYTHWAGIIDHSIHEGFKAYYKCDYTATITFEGVVDGKIKIEVSETSQPQQGDIIYDTPLGWMIYKVDGKWDGWITNIHAVDEGVRGAGKIAEPVAIPTNLKKELQSELNVYVLPGGSQLFFGDIFFNTEGDMVLGATMKS